MTDNEPQSADQQDDKKPLGLNRPGRLELKKTVESGQVRQSFSHGRTKTVQVEKKKKRTFQRSQTGNMTEVRPTTEGFVSPTVESTPEKAVVEEAAIRQLTVEEKAARARAVEGALKAEHEVKEGVEKDADHHEASIDPAPENLEEVAEAAELAVPIDKGSMPNEEEPHVEDGDDLKTGALPVEAVETIAGAANLPSSEKSEQTGSKGPAREDRGADRAREGDDEADGDGRGGDRDGRAELPVVLATERCEGLRQFPIASCKPVHVHTTVLGVGIGCTDEHPVI